MDYVQTLIRINTMSNAVDAEDIATAISNLTGEERSSAKEAFYRAVLTKARDGHPNIFAMASYALKLKAG